jgi:hypothetical protein
MKNKQNFIKTVITIIGAFVIAILISNVFLYPNSPKVNPLALKKTQYYLSKITAVPGNVLLAMKNYLQKTGSRLAKRTPQSGIVPTNTPYPTRRPDNLFGLPYQNINPQFPTGSQAQPTLTTDPLAEIPQVTAPAGLNYSPLAPGVSAANDTQANKTYIIVEAGTTLQVQEFTLSDGRVIKVITPVE